MTHPKPIAALYIDPKGGYPGMPGVDPWDEARDARGYEGPWPLVAHPPCTRWCRLAGLVEARWGHKRGHKRGDDGGCFKSALRNVRKYGGVLEHPAFSAAWKAHGLRHPPTGGRWVRADILGGRTCYVEQGRYGHRAKKATWLYAIKTEFPDLLWGHNPDQKSEARVSWCGNHVSSGEVRPRLSAFEAKATPPEFRAVLIALARSVYK